MSGTFREEAIVGIELGGTTIVIAIGKRSFNQFGIALPPEIFRKYEFETEDPKKSVETMFKWLKKHTVMEYDCIGVASFGPICLDKSSQQYGYITSTPKLNWTNFPMI